MLLKIYVFPIQCHGSKFLELKPMEAAKHLLLLISTKLPFFDCKASLSFDPKFAHSLFVCEVALSCEKSLNE